MNRVTSTNFSIELGVFAKPPEAHKVKTRLIPDIGAKPATEVYRQCLQHALNVAAASHLGYCCYLTELSDEPVFKGLEQRLQYGPDLGERMLNAFDEMLGNHEAAIIIGTDCLDMTAVHLQQAARVLEQSDLVIQPVYDGGYSLIGCRKIDRSIFDGVQWSTEDVLSRTLQNAERLGFQVTLLDTVRDIDTLDDLKQYPQFSTLIADSPDN